MPDRFCAGRWSWVLLAVLVGLGLAVQSLELIEWRSALELARQHPMHWWLPPGLVLLQVVLFAFALPGSAVLWLVAPLYAPLAATAILTVGGCVGAWAAQTFARRLSAGSLARLSAGQGYRLLQRESDFLMLCALRLAPGVPHSLINYSAGALGLRLAPFLISSAVGFALKSFLYSSVIDSALLADRPADLLSPGVVLALVGGVVLTLFARGFVRRKH